MARTRAYDQGTVVVAAKELFWQRGLEGTAIGDLEAATGLSRSSLYLAFGAKRALFDAALADYLDTFIDPLLAPVEAPQSGLAEAARFFRRLAALFADPRSRRGCLMINTIAELAGRDPTFTGPAAQFVNRYRAAFANALRGDAAQGDRTRREIARRSELLAVSTMGVWLAVRTDPTAAAHSCRAVANEITSWVRADQRPRSRNQ
ncbi:MAG: TetR/AcrR family transcriptional regulator, transcriptional repressor for nem operon [Actinomycetota bacterium]|jgi:AcrR family transcriptional regulator